MFSWRALRIDLIEEGHTYLTEALEGDDVECVALYKADASGLPMHVVGFPPAVGPLLPRLVELLNQ